VKSLSLPASEIFVLWQFAGKPKKYNKSAFKRNYRYWDVGL